MNDLTPNNIPEPEKSVAEIHAEAIDKATKIYAMLKEAGYTAEDLAVTDFLINPHKPPHMPHPAPCPPPKPPCPPPHCEVAEFTAPRPIVHPHAPHKDHDHNMMPPCPPMKPMPICPPPVSPCPPKPQGAFPPFMNNCGVGVKPPMPNGGAQRVAQADWAEPNPFSASYIYNKPNVVLSINGEKPNPETGNIELNDEDLGMKAMTNEELSGIINDVFHIFSVNNNNNNGCNCGCNA